MCNTSIKHTPHTDSSFSFLRGGTGDIIFSFQKIFFNCHHTVFQFFNWQHFIHKYFSKNHIVQMIMDKSIKAVTNVLKIILKKFKLKMKAWLFRPVKQDNKSLQIGFKKKMNRWRCLYECKLQNINYLYTLYTLRFMSKGR